MGMLGEYWDKIKESDYAKGVVNRVQNPGQAFLTALKDVYPTKENPFGGVGAGALTKGQAIFRGTQRAPDLATVSQRLQNPGNEFGMHVTRDPSTADLMQYNYQTGGKGGVIGMQSNVGKPLVLPDTGGRWTPDIVADSILSNSTNKALKSDVEKFKAEYAYNQATGNKDMDMWAKRLQEMIKSHGYDHISYENVKEGVPSESAILFDKGGFKNPHTDTTVPKIQGFHGSKTPLSGDVSLNFSGKTSGIPEERAFWLAPTKDEALKFADMAGGNHVTSFDINNSRVKQIPVSIQDITKNTLNKAEEIGKAKQEGFDVLHFVYPKSKYISLEDEFAVINPQVLQKTGEGYNKQFDNLHYTDPFPDTTR